MTLFQICALYIGLNLLILPVLMMRVGQVRMAKKVNLGDGGDSGLFARIRAHANFTETTPFALIGLIGLAMMSAPSILLHIFGAGFTIGRLAHAHGMAAKNAAGQGRVVGALLSLLTFVGMGAFLIYKAFTG